MILIKIVNLNVQFHLPQSLLKPLIDDIDSSGWTAG